MARRCCTTHKRQKTKDSLLCLLFSLMIFLISSTVGVLSAQELGTRLAPVGPRVVFNTVDPVLRKWYPPQELYRYYKWEWWKYSNYARNLYERYVDITLEGERWYDMYGSYITWGWQVYDWRQEQPTPFGSTILKQPQFKDWFNHLLIASDSKGQHYMSLTVGEQIRSSLTPMTFAKPAFSGVQWDYMSDKHELTILTSRINEPGAAKIKDFVWDQTDFTNLLGFRGTTQVGDFFKVGATYVNAHIGRADESYAVGSIFKGALSTSQNSDVIRWVSIRISDDSPEDGVGGGALFSEQIWTRRVNPSTGAVIKEWGQEKRDDLTVTVEGGFQRRGYLAADGRETITLTYTIPDPYEVERMGFDFVLSNDYRVEMTSNLQTNVDGLPVFLPVVSAPGNVRDNSNQRVVRFEYGLPTSNMIYGWTLEADDLFGFTLRGEYDINRRYRKFPNVNLDNHSPSYDRAQAFYFTLFKLAFPWYGYGEVFSIDKNYSTTMFIVGPAGEIDYERSNLYVYEFIDDNDDQDRSPDWPEWIRKGMPRDDNGVFPGLDDNNDFRSDFNQNNNLRPDYEEPFLRYTIDPPEFLFGVDMNNNTVIDRFENDALPDYPFKADHRGYNLYIGGEIAPQVDLKIGRLHEWTLSSNTRSRGNYLLFTFERDYPKLGRIQVFDHLKGVKDNLPDDVILWEQPAGTKGIQKSFQDPLVTRNTVVHTAYVGFDLTRVPDLNVINKIKYETYTQQDEAIPVLVGGNVDTLTFRDSRFLGIINKLDYTLHLGKQVTLQPKFRSMYRYQTPFREDGTQIEELTETAFLIVRFPVLSRSWLELGYEGTWFNNLREEGGREDFSGSIGALQFSNTMSYLGYDLTTKVGFQVEWRRFEGRRETNTKSFLSVYAGSGK